MGLRRHASLDVQQPEDARQRLLFAWTYQYGLSGIVQCFSLTTNQWILLFSISISQISAKRYGSNCKPGPITEGSYEKGVAPCRRRIHVIGQSYTTPSWSQAMLIRADVPCELKHMRPFGLATLKLSQFHFIILVPFPLDFDPYIINFILFYLFIYLFYYY